MPTDDPDHGVDYAVDAADRLVFVGRGWDDFAARGHAPHLAGAGVLGRALWDFVTGATTCAIYRDLLWRVRSGRAVEFPFRCDCPRWRRTLRMSMSPLKAGGVLFRTALLSLVPASAVLWDTAVPRGGPPVRSCAWCKRVWADGAWAEVEDAVAALGLLEGHTLPPVTHGICDGCISLMMSVHAG